MSEYNYFPIIKTTEAELKGYKHLTDSVRKSIFPIFELTKSRRSKKNPDGKVEKKITKLKDILKNQQFILDLTMEESYSNKEIAEMTQNNTAGYDKWCKFVFDLKKEGLNLLPIIHYNPLHKEDVKQQIDKLKTKFNFLAFRIEAFHKTTRDFIKDFVSLLSKEDHKKIILILDGRVISVEDISERTNGFLSLINDVYKIINPKEMIVSCSGFPKSVIEKGYGGDETGEFDISEVSVYEKIFNQYSNILYGDYASIHPKRYDLAGGSWIPRIDFPLNKEIFYYRYRRNGSSHDSYVKAAKKIKKHEKYSYIKSWGNDEILQASEGNVNGRNPSHWIAVRMNIHMTRQQEQNRRSVNF